MAVTKTANVNVRIQENIKQQAEQILETIGVPRATAIDMFYRQIILNKGCLLYTSDAADEGGIV